MTNCLTPQMSPLGDNELARLQAAQVSSLMDTCVLMQYTTIGETTYGTPVERWLDCGSYPCGFRPTVRRELLGQSEVPEAEAELRLSINTAVEHVERIRLTHRYHVAITPEEYDVVGEPKRGPSGLVLLLKKVGG